METITSIRQLFLEQLRDRYDSETQQVEALPRMLQKATSVQLKHVIHMSMEHSQKHLKRLEHIFKGMGENPVGELCEGTIGLLHEAWELMKRAASPDIMDAAIITSIQHIHNNDIAGYQTLLMYARYMDDYELTKLLRSMLDDELKTDDFLTEMVEEIIAKHNEDLVSEN